MWRVTIDQRTPSGSTKRHGPIKALYYRDPCPLSNRYPAGWAARIEHYVVDRGLKSEAAFVVDGWLDADPARRENLHQVSYYPRVYVSMERDLRGKGRVIA